MMSNQELSSAIEKAFEMAIQCLPRVDAYAYSSAKENPLHELTKEHLKHLLAIQAAKAAFVNEPPIHVEMNP